MKQFISLNNNLKCCQYEITASILPAKVKSEILENNKVQDDVRTQTFF